MHESWEKMFVINSGVLKWGITHSVLRLRVVKLEMFLFKRESASVKFIISNLIYF